MLHLHEAERQHALFYQLEVHLLGVEEVFELALAVVVLVLREGLEAAKQGKEHLDAFDGPELHFACLAAR